MRKQLPLLTALILLSPLASALDISNVKSDSSAPQIQPVQRQKAFADLERLKVAARLYLREYDRELEQAGPEWSPEDSDANANLIALHQLVDSKEQELLDAVEKEAPSERAFVEKFIDSDPNIDTLEINRFFLNNPDLARLIDSVRTELGLTPQLVSLRHKPVKRGPFVPGHGRNGSINGDEFPRGTWALTLDDGPHRVYGPRMVAVAMKYNVPLTFFWLAKNVQANLKQVKWIGSLGYPRENHSYTHPMLAFLGVARLKHEIEDSNAVETKAFGEAPRFFRCPYGSGSNDGSLTRRMIAKNNMVDVFWNVDSRDWADHNPSSVARRVLAQMNARRGGIILFHEIHKSSVPAVQLVLAAVKSRDYRWVTVPQIVDEMNLAAEQLSGAKPADPVTKTNL